MKVYRIFVSHPGGSWSRNTRDYDVGTHPWVVEVRAENLPTAVHLVHRQRVSVRKGEGIVAVTRHDSGVRAQDWHWHPDVEVLIPDWLKA